VDLNERLRRLDRDGSMRERDARALADRWARAAGGGRDGEASAALLLALAWPERIARSRGAPGDYLTVSGRGVFLEPAEALARAPWLAVGEVGGGRDARDR